MAEPYPVNFPPVATPRARERLRTILGAVLLALGCCAVPASADPLAEQAELSILVEQRQALESELEHYQKTLALLNTENTPPQQSSNPAVRKLAEEKLRIQQQLLSLAEREVALRREQLAAQDRSDNGTPEESATPQLESRPLNVHSPDYNAEQETENVARLHRLLNNYYTDLQESEQTLPSPEEVARREAAAADASNLARIPFSAGKLRLTGAEGSTALAQISRRLADPAIPESRRDIAPILSARTHLFGSLIASESRSLRPVGKNHYIARIRLQPGDSTLRIRDDRWELRLPQNVNAGDYLVTLYAPPGGTPELHVFAVSDLLAVKGAHLPAWLPAEIGLNQAG